MIQQNLNNDEKQISRDSEKYLPDYLIRLLGQSYLSANSKI